MRPLLFKASPNQGMTRFCRASASKRAGARLGKPNVCLPQGLKLLQRPTHTEPRTPTIPAAHIPGMTLFCGATASKRGEPEASLPQGLKQQRRPARNQRRHTSDMPGTALAIAAAIEATLPVELPIVKPQKSRTATHSHPPARAEFTLHEIISSSLRQAKTFR
jgi:hypothetical protein